MNTAYPLIPVSIITILAYLVTWLFASWGIFSLKSHRKFWNVLLLATFLISGLLGLLSVVKVNYKLTIPHYDTYMQWHVSFGIGMVIIAFFHLYQNIRYYLKLFKKSREKKNEAYSGNSFTPDLIKVRYLLFLLGAAAMIVQVVFIREFISVLAGNELVMGIVMGSWLLLTALGAYVGRKRVPPGFNLEKGINMLSGYSVFPIITIWLLYWLKQLLYPPGTLIGITATTAGALILLFPVCFLSGYLFTAYSTVYSESKNKNLIGKAYAFESIGSLAGGLLFSLILGRLFNSFQTLGLATGIIIMSGAWLKGFRHVKNTVFYLSAGIMIPVLIFIVKPDNRVKKVLFPNQEILLNKSTPYGNLLVTKQAGQLNFYENNALQFYTDNVMVNEEAVHFALVQHRNPKTVLLISGGIAGMIHEINKYHVQQITYLETNPEIYKYWKNLSGQAGELANTKFIKSDIRIYLKKTKSKYDVILINLPAPSTLGFNRFYTSEFFKILKKHCNSQTVICTSLPSSANYAEENALDVNASLWKTLHLHFKNCLLLTGEKNYFLASDNNLSSDITKLIEEKGIENEYVNKYYLNDELLAQRSHVLTSQFDRPVRINHDFYPYMFIKQSNHWLSHFGTRYYLLALVPAIIFVFLFSGLNPVSMGLYTGGFSAASLEVTLMLAYQVFFGSIYLATALFFAFFMGGLVAGSLWKNSINKASPYKSYYLIQFIIAAFSLILPLIIYLTGNITAFLLPAQFIFFLLIFILAFCIGHEFNLAAQLQPYTVGETSGRNYSTDLAGSAFGAFLTAIVLLPLTGLIITCLIIGGLNIFSATMVLNNPVQ